MNFMISKFFLSKLGFLGLLDLGQILRTVNHEFVHLHAAFEDLISERMLFGFQVGHFLLIDGFFLFELVFEGLDLKKELDFESPEITELIELFALNFFPVNFLYFLLFSDLPQKFVVLFI